MEFDIPVRKIFARIRPGSPSSGISGVTETLVVSWIVMLIITGLCAFS